MPSHTDTRATRVARALMLDAPRLALVSDGEAAAGYERLLADAREAAKVRDQIVAELIDSGAAMVGHGMQRIVLAYEGAPYVIKVPWEHAETRGPYAGPHHLDLLLTANMRSNVNEVLAYELAVLAWPVMPCRLVWHETGMPLVLMERFTAAPAGAGGCPWSQEAWEELDGSQFGWSQLLGCHAVFDAGFPPRTCREQVSQGERVLHWSTRLADQNQLAA